MPSGITHAFAAEDIYKRLDQTSKSMMGKNSNLMKSFAQGPDPFFASIINKYNDQNIGDYMHEHGTKDLFINYARYMLKLMKEDSINELENIIAALYGMISHYVLDKTIHPYVYYMTGVYDKNNPDTYKYNGLHQMLETLIESYMVELKTKQPLNLFKAHEYCFDIDWHVKNFPYILDQILKDTYNINNLGQNYLTRLKLMRIVYKYLRYDNDGKKRIRYQRIDKFLGLKREKKEWLSYHNDYRETIDGLKSLEWLNLDKSKWINPTDNNVTSSESYPELYERAISDTISLINRFNKSVFSNCSIEGIDEQFDLSYLFGNECKDKSKAKIFLN